MLYKRKLMLRDTPGVLLNILNKPKVKVSSSEAPEYYLSIPQKYQSSLLLRDGMKSE